MFGDQEVTLSFEVIPNPKGLLETIDVLMKNAASLEVYQGLMSAKTVISQAVHKESVRQVVSADLLLHEAAPGHIMNWTVDIMKKDLQAQALRLFDVTIMVVNKEE